MSNAILPKYYQNRYFPDYRGFQNYINKKSTCAVQLSTDQFKFIITSCCKMVELINWYLCI